MREARNPRVAALGRELQKARDGVTEGSIEDRVLGILQAALLPAGEDARGPGRPPGPRDAFTFWASTAQPGESFIDSEGRTAVTLMQSAKRYGRKVTVRTATLLSGSLGAPDARSVFVVTVTGLSDESSSSTEDPGAAGNSEPGDSGSAPEGTPADASS